MSEIEEMENTMDEAIEAANEVNNILVQSGEGNGAVAESGTDGDPVLTTEQKKKAINLQDLIYIKKYIQNMAASLKSEVKSDMEASYYKKTDTVANATTAGRSQILMDANGVEKMTAASKDDYILPTSTTDGKAKICLGSGNYKFKEMWSENFNGPADHAKLLKHTLENGMYNNYAYINLNGKGTTVKLMFDCVYLPIYYPDYYLDDAGSLVNNDMDFAIHFTPITLQNRKKEINFRTEAIGGARGGDKSVYYILRITSHNPENYDNGNNYGWTIYKISNGVEELFSNPRGMIKLIPILTY